MNPYDLQMEILRVIAYLNGDSSIALNTSKICANCKFFQHPSPAAGAYFLNVCTHPSSIDIVRGGNLPAATMRWQKNLCGPAGSLYVAAPTLASPGQEGV